MDCSCCDCTNGVGKTVTGIASATGITAWGQAVTVQSVSYERPGPTGIAMTLAIGETTRMTGSSTLSSASASTDITQAQVSVYKWSSSGFPDDTGPTGLITAFTPAIFPSQAPTDVDFSLAPDEPAITPTGDRPRFADENYFNSPVQIEGPILSLYRDGELVWQATRPNKTASQAFTNDEGVYLLVAEHDERDPEYTTGLAKPFQVLRSFVIDKTAPRIGASVPRDWFVDERSGFFGDQLPPPGRAVVVATKPLSSSGATDYLLLSSDDTSASWLVRPQPFRGNFMGWQRVGDKLPYEGLPVGTHTLELIRLGSPLSTWYDMAGNYAIAPTVSVTVHPVPANNKRGATVEFEDLGRQTREYDRARLPSEAVQQVRLTFSRKVDANTVQSSQLQLTKNGVAVSGCTLSQVTETEWLVTLPEEEEQTPGSFWMLTYAPAGEVLTADTDEPEPCVLATRVSWLMAKDWLVPLDASVSMISPGCGLTASVSEHIDKLPADDGSGVGDKEYFANRSANYADGYEPRVPPPSVTGPTGASWAYGYSEWPSDGMDYSLPETFCTIFPSEPKELRCKAPSNSQRHLTILRCNEDVLSIRFKMVVTGNNGGPAQGDYRQSVEPVIAAMLTERTASNTRDGVQLQSNTWFHEVQASLFAPQAEPNKPNFTGMCYFTSFSFTEADPANFPAILRRYGVLYTQVGTGNTYTNSPNGLVQSAMPLDKDGNQFGNVGVVGGEVWFNTFRACNQHAGLKTTILYEPVLRMWGYVVVRGIDVTNGVLVDTNWLIHAFVPASNAFWRAQGWWWTLSRQQEELFAGGVTLSLPFNGASPPDSASMEVKIG